MRISTSKVRITPVAPFFPCYLCGHAIRVDKAVGVADDLFVNTVVLETIDEKLLFITVDLAGMSKECSDEIRSTLSERYHVPAHHVNVGYIHTHSGPEFDISSPFHGKERGAVPGYLEFVIECIYQSVAEAMEQKRTEVTAYTKRVTIEGYYGNRNGLDKPCDKDIITVEFRHGDQVVAGICNFACHPTILGPQNLYVSADFAGYLARALEQKWNAPCLIMLGAAGDMSNRLYRQGNDYAELTRVGDGVLAQINAVSEETKLEIRKLQTKVYTYHEEYRFTQEERVQAIVSITNKIEHAANFDEKKVYTSALAGAKAKQSRLDAVLDFDATYYDLGDLKIFTMPCELFSRFGIEIKEAMNAPCSLFWGYSNYSIGYLANEEDYGKSFETAISDYPKGITEKLVGQIIALIKE